MGIPKFYRWTSERYPCLSERIKEYQIPEFDNLYLDMNGIIHNCSHPNDEDIHLRIPEQQIFKDIFHYIDFLFKMIKPCKVFFMAVDGVAPRAKMNQQRGRRFRSARLAEDQEAEAIRQGETLPSQERFDSNCITPGTEFMARLHEQLKYFVQVKVSTDPLWQRSGLVIYLSGHDVPGEGEHKIMDFIRHERSRADYEPVRHCLYGLDADLVMLGLSTHELQFSLLREEVKFSRPRKPKKGVKQAIPPKPNNDTANYDLTNVSIFKYDQNGVPGSLPTSSESAEIVESALLKEGQSFSDAIDKPLEQLSLRSEAPPASAHTSNKDDSAPPPPPEESGAKGFFKAPLPEKTTFLLLHLSLMRDYIDFEFQDLKKNLANHPNIQYDLESVIDDWILMNILVGNDFVPHLPHVHIVKGALPMLYQLYSQVLPTLDGYINENGLLNLRRFEIFINKLSQFDIETFRDTYDDMKYMESKTGKNIVLGEKMFEGFDFDGDNFTEEPLEPTMSPELKALAERTEEEVFGETKDGPGKLCTDVFGIDDKYFNSGDSPELRLEFLQHKRNYYISKLHFDEITPEFLQIFCKEYIRAIQWVLLYYYKGVSSWGWFYPYHYAPFCSDLKNFANFSIEFDIGNPFRPFEQLLAVLPAQSKKLLPNCYQWLMTDTKSPIVDFYPEKFEQDLNGKKQDWEAVVLIPFIDEQKLLDVMKIEEINLNREELHRNSKGTMMLCSYTPEETGPIKSASNLFPVLESSHVKIETMNDVTYDPLTLPKGIHPKTKKDTIYQGFPTLKSKPINAIIDKADIKVFDFVTREESMILSLEDVKDDPADIAALSRKLIGRTVWVNWPHLTFAYVTGILTYKGKYFQDYAGKIMLDNELIGSRVEKEFNAIAKGLSQRHLKCKGIKLGEIKVIVYAKMMEGRKVRCNNSGDVEFETLWSKLQQPFALKTCMYEENITEIFYLDRQLAKSYTELFKIGDDVFYLGDKLFGALGTVVGYDVPKKSVLVDFKVVPGSNNNNSEVNLKSCVGHNILKSHDYFSSYAAAGKCQISSYVLSRITGTVFVSVEKETKANNKMLAKKAAALAKRGSGTDVSPTDASNSSSDDDFPALEMRKINVGLDLKFNKKNLEVRGYTSKRDGAWFYSGKAVQLVNEFVMEFSDFISFLSRVEKGRDVFDAGEFFPDKPLERINEMVEWLEEKGVRDLPRIPTNTKLLDDEDIDSVWKYILKHKSPSKKTTIKKWTVQPNFLLKPGLDRGCVPPIPHCSYTILDRVICVDRGAPIPVGRRGTIVGIQTPQASEPEQIEESFKSTGAATLMTLIILCDPAADVFDNPENVELSNSERKELSGTLASLLRITDPGQETVGFEMPKASKRSVSSDLKPRLIKLYPYQLLNLTEGPVTLRQSHKDSKQLQTITGFHMNGHVKQPQKLQELTQNRIVPLMSQSVGTIQSRSSAPGQSSSAKNNKDFVPFESKRVQASKQKQQLAPVPQDYTNKPSKPEQLNKAQIQIMGRVSNNGTLDKTAKALPWPPQPLVKVEVPINESFSVAAFLQQQFNAAPINKQKEVHNKQQPPPAHPPVETAIKEPPLPEYMHAVPKPLMPAINVRPKQVNQSNPPKGCSEIFSAATAYHPPSVHPESIPVVQPTAAHGSQEPNQILEMLNKATTRHYNSKKPRSQQQQQSRKGKGPGPSAPPVNLPFSACRPPVPSPPSNWTQHRYAAPIVPTNSTNHPQREQRQHNFHSRQFVSQRFFVPLQVSRNASTASSKRQPNPRIPQTPSNNRAEQLPEKQLAGDSISQPGSSSKTSTETVSKKEPVLKLAPVEPQESAPTTSSAETSKPQGRKSRLAANFGNNC